ncbi:MAG: MFS transporter, partial [Candidatus Rokuibacteriota bacterium]
MGTAMLVTGLVTAFPALLATQMLWGLSWTFSTGADVAWLTDELDRPERVAGVLTRAARYEQVGAAAGLVGLGGLASVTNLSTAMVAAGLAMWALGLYVATRFPERNFTPTPRQRWRESVSIFRRGIDLARRDRDILLVFAATVLVNGAAEGFGRLHDKWLVELGFPETLEPIAWLTALGVLTLGVGALVLRLVEMRIDREAVAPRIYSAACLVGALGMAVLALAPDAVTGMAGVLLVRGIAWTVTRTVAVIWVNRRTASDVRATVQSFLARGGGIPVAMLGSCVLVASAGVLVARSRAGRIAG